MSDVFEPEEAVGPESEVDTKYTLDPESVGNTSLTALEDERDYVQAHVPKQPKMPRSLPAPIRTALGDRKPVQMTPEEVAQVKALVGVGKTQKEIAALLGRKLNQVTRAAQQQTAKEILKASEGKLTRAWVRSAEVAARRGRHEPAQAALVAIGAVEGEGKGSGGGITVNVGIALPGTPGGDRQR